jgi:hypothetical protein
VYIRGKILYANFDWNKLISTQYLGYDSFITFLAELYYSKFNPMRKVHNRTKYMGYFSLAKSDKGGKFLVIDSDVYGNDMFFNLSNVVLSNLASENSSKRAHESIPSL